MCSVREVCVRTKAVVGRGVLMPTFKRVHHSGTEAVINQDGTLPLAVLIQRSDPQFNPADDFLSQDLHISSPLRVPAEDLCRS